MLIKRNIRKILDDKILKPMFLISKIQKHKRLGGYCLDIVYYSDLREYHCYRIAPVSLEEFLKFIYSDSVVRLSNIAFN